MTYAGTHRLACVVPTQPSLRSAAAYEMQMGGREVEPSAIEMCLSGGDGVTLGSRSTRDAYTKSFRRL
jgi:hypothetical protein